MYVVGFSGPPKVGKDTAARMMADYMDSQGVTLPVIEVSLSMPLRAIAYAMTGMVGPMEGQFYESFKETQFNQFLGKTGRELMIDVSERFLKPVYQSNIMTRMLFDPLFDFHGVVLIRDMGFQVELNTAVKYVGEDNLYLVNMSRKDAPAIPDSREPVQHKHSMTIENDSGLHQLATEVCRAYGRLVNQMGWKL